MKYNPNKETYGSCMTHNLGGRVWNHRHEKWKDMRLLTLMWRLLKIFFRYGNQEIYYHICGSGSAYDVPMNAENVEVRLSNCGPKVTIW